MSFILLRGVSRRITALIACETAMILLVIGLAAYVRLGIDGWRYVWSFEGFLKSSLMATAVQLSLYYADLYDPRAAADRRELVVRIFHALAGSALFLAVVYYWAPSLVVGRGVFAIAAVFVMVTVILWRIVFDWLARYATPRERLLLVGTSAGAVRLARELYERRDLGIQIVGFVDPNPAKVGMPVINPGVIGTLEDIPRIINDHTVDRVVVSLSDARGQLPMNQLLDMKFSGVQFDHLASVYEEYTGKIALENLRPSWLIFSTGFRKSRVLQAAKRTVDLLAGAIGLVLATPLMLVIAVAIRLSGPGAILYHQVRVGQHGRLFRVHKFRSMIPNAEAATGPVWAKPGTDMRVTRLGRLLRQLRLDELPQLWNVVLGEMSLVGPRPERPEFVEGLAAQIPFYKQRLVAKPGLSGWAQVRYTYGATAEDAMEKLQYDLYYIKHMSLALDLFILFKTVQTVVMRRGV